MLNAIRYAREKQRALLRHLPRHADRLHRVRAQRLRPARTPTPASSIPPRQHRVIYKLRELLGVEEMGGTMRLGAWTCILQPDSLAVEGLWRRTEISERHRHRYEFNREYEALLTGAGLRITGTTPDATYVEIVEIPDHPYFLGCQFHPEFKSKPLEPHPLFREFVTASYANRRKQNTELSTADPVSTGAEEALARPFAHR